MKTNSPKKIWILAISLVVIAALLAVLFRATTGVGTFKPPVIINGIEAPPVPSLDSGRVARGAELYAQYCASCHGVNLEGASNWKQPLADGSFPPPPHTDQGHTWHHPDSFLIEVIAKGSAELYGGTMPGFGSQLSLDEIEMILDFIKSRWGQETRELQWWVTATGN